MRGREIYLDYAATTPLDPAVVEVMAESLGADGDFANPASSHAPGRRAKARIETARAQIGERIGAPPETVRFTSGATESDNLALVGAMRANRHRGRHLITSALEHKAILDTAHALQAQGTEVTYIEHGPDGIIDPDRLAEALRDDTVLVSIMHVNNETGVVQDIAALGGRCRERGALFHVDAAQSTGKLPLSVGDWPVDLVSLTAHKTYGPMGIGAICIRPGVRLEPLIHGGSQEGGLRPGTLPTHQIAGFGKAFELADPARDGPLLAGKRDRLWAGLSVIEGVRLNGHPTQRSPHVLSVTFPGVDGESLQLALADVAVSAGSACNADVPDPSHVLRGMGLSDALAASTLRFSVGRFTTDAEIDHVVGAIQAEVPRLRVLASGAPRWTAG
ncbi:MAG: cysteine desulfurase family protein [Rhodospirillaceae bacterium]|nr:cysteine desulfurase family protein [Rhodospirillaceae bacterium]